MYVKVRVQPDSKKERVAKVGKQEYEMMVKEPAERNMANKRVREILAGEYNKSIGEVRMISGHRSQSKMLYIDKTSL